MRSKTLLIIMLLPAIAMAQQPHPIGFNHWLTNTQRNEQIKSKTLNTSDKLLNDSYFLSGTRTDTFDMVNSIWRSIDSAQYLYSQIDSTLSSYNRVVNDPDSGWISYLATYYFYNPLKQDTGEIYQFYDNINDVWDNESRITYAYDDDGNVLINTIYNWIDSISTWVNSSQIQNAYDSNYNLIQSALFSWNNSTLQWDSLGKFVYAYDSSNNQILETDYFGGIPSYQYSRYYNFAALDTEAIGKIWSGNNWKNNVKDTFAYDASKNLILFIRYDWSNSAHLFNKTDTKTEYAYDGQNQVVSRLDYNGDGATTFYPADSFGYQYNLDDNLIYSLLKNYSTATSSFVNFQQTFYYYTDFLSGINSVMKNNSSFSLYPCPAHNSLQLRVTTGDETKIRLELWDEKGNILSSFSQTLVQGENSIILDVLSLAPGAYFLKLADDENKIQSVRKFIKQ